MKLHAIAFALVIIGGLNWGLVGLGGFMGTNLNVINLLLGSWPMLDWSIYLLVGLSAISLMFSHKKNCRVCDVSAPAM